MGLFFSFGFSRGQVAPLDLSDRTLAFASAVMIGRGFGGLRIPALVNPRFVGSNWAAPSGKEKDESSPKDSSFGRLNAELHTGKATANGKITRI